MRAIWKGFVSFGLVTIPVGVGLAQERSADVSFRTLSRATLRPVKQKRFDADRDVEVGADDVVKGYEFAKGQFVPVEDDELERFAARQEKTIEILQFVQVPEVDPVYFDRAYWLEPQERAERPYALLVEAMKRSGRAAVGRFVLSTKEHLVLLRPFDGMLTLETLYYPEDIRIRDQREISERLGGVEVKEAELDMAMQLVEGLTRPFDAAEYPNETRAALLDFLHAKAAGHEPAEVPEAPRAAPVVDLMAALRASLAAAGGAPSAGGDADGGAKAATPARAARGKAKTQLSIDEGRLRRMEGGGEDLAEGQEREAQDAAPARKRTRKAS
jgi:DNA end-binding protein Ku